MYLLNAPINKFSLIQDRIYFVFLKHVLKQTWESFNSKFGPEWKDQKSCYHVT